MSARHSNLVDIERTTPCRTCGADIGFLKGKKSGKWYAVNVLVDSSTPDKRLVASPFGFHKCHPQAS